MKITHVLLSSRFAGTERYVVDLVAAQAARGHEVSLVLRRKAVQDRPDAIAHRVDPAVEVILARDWLARWPMGRDTVAAIGRIRPDIVHAHLGGACRAMKSVAGPPRVSTLHIRYKPQQHAHLDGLIAIAPWQLAAIPSPLREHSVQIDNWTVPRAPSPGARALIRAQHGIADDAFLVGALGRVEHGKGMDVLVDAFGRAALPGARLAIVGHGKAWESVRKQAPPEVVMPGFASRPEDWMAAFDAFVSPARDEPFGLVLLEAMQAGLPIVATASEGARHLATAIGTPLVPIDDADALAAALRTLLAGRPHAPHYPMERFRIEQKATEIEDFYAGILARRA